MPQSKYARPTANRVFTNREQPIAWVRELVAASPGVLFVIFGRDRLTWDSHFPDDWAGYLDDSHPLGGLSVADADSFLQKIPVPEAEIRQAMITASKGELDPLASLQNLAERRAHPFYLDLTVDTYLDIKQKGREPQADDFGKTYSEIVARFLRYRDLSEQTTLKLLSAPRSFDYALFAALIVRLQTGYPATAIAELAGFSFIEMGADGRYRLHALMRDHLYAELDPHTRGELEAFLFQWFDERCQVANPKEVTAQHIRNLHEAVYHRHTTDPEAALAWFWQKLQVFYDAARYADIEPLQRWALDLAETKLGDEHPKTATALNNLALLLQDTNRLTEAEPLMRRMQEILFKFTVDTGYQHPNFEQAKINYATLLEQMGFNQEQIEAQINAARCLASPFDKGG